MNVVIITSDIFKSKELGQNQFSLNCGTHIYKCNFFESAVVSEIFKYDDSIGLYSEDTVLRFI